jgi:AcrR family transcriptional regulator
MTNGSYNLNHYPISGVFALPKTTFLRLHEEKQERIMRAAIDEFQENGFANANIGRIADKAGIAKGSIYQYFEDKVDFFLYAVQWTLQYFQNNMAPITPIENMDVFEYLLGSGRQKIDLLKKESVLVKFSRDFQSGRYSELSDEINEEIRQDGDAFILRLIQNGKHRGTIRQDVGDEALMLFCKGMIGKIDELALKVIEDCKDDPGGKQLRKMDETVRSFLKLIRTGMGS